MAQLGDPNQRGKGDVSRRKVGMCGEISLHHHDCFAPMFGAQIYWTTKKPNCLMLIEFNPNQIPWWRASTLTFTALLAYLVEGTHGLVLCVSHPSRLPAAADTLMPAIAIQQMPP